MLKYIISLVYTDIILLLTKQIQTHTGRFGRLIYTPKTLQKQNIIFFLTFDLFPLNILYKDDP